MQTRAARAIRRQLEQGTGLCRIPAYVIKCRLHLLTVQLCLLEAKCHQMKFFLKMFKFIRLTSEVKKDNEFLSEILIEKTHNGIFLNYGQKITKVNEMTDKFRPPKHQKCIGRVH